MNDTKIKQMRDGLFDDYDRAIKAISAIIHRQITDKQDGSVDKKKKKKVMQLQDIVDDFLDVLRIEKTIDDLLRNAYRVDFSKETGKIYEQIKREILKRKTKRKLELEKLLKKGNFTSSCFIAPKTGVFLIGGHFPEHIRSSLNLYYNEMSGKLGYDHRAKEYRIISGYSIYTSLINTGLLEEVMKGENNFKTSAARNQKNYEKRLEQSKTSAEIQKVVEQFERIRKSALRLVNSLDVKGVEKNNIRTMLSVRDEEIKSIIDLDEKEQRLQRGLEILKKGEQVFKKGNKNLILDLRVSLEKDLEEIKSTKSKLLSEFMDACKEMERKTRRISILISNEARLANLKEQQHQLINNIGNLSEAEFQRQQDELDQKIDEVYAKHPEIYEKEQKQKEQQKKTNDYMASTQVEMSKESFVAEKPKNPETSYDPVVKTTILSEYMIYKIKTNNNPETQLSFSQYIQAMHPEETAIIEDVKKEEEQEASRKK